MLARRALLVWLCLVASAWADVSLEAPAFDPKLDGAELGVRSGRDGQGTYRATLRLRDAGGALVRTLLRDEPRERGRSYRDAWDGLDDAGRFVAPGRYSVELTGGGAAEQAPAQVVRLGLLSIGFEGSGQVPLAYHRPDAGVSGNPLPLAALGAAYTLPRSALGADCLDAGDGRPLDLPSPWTDVAAPPRTGAGSLVGRGRSLPVAYQAGSIPTLRIELGASAAYDGAEVDCGYPLADLPLRLQLGAASSGALRPGQVVRLAAAPLDDAVGAYVLDLELRFEAFAGGAWRALPGRIQTRHPLYVTLGPPPGGEPAWVAAVDLVCGWAQGSRGVDEVLAAAVQGVNAALGLRYDAYQGAPAYTDVPWGSLAWPLVELGAFLDDRLYGRVVNCLDCAGVVSALGRQAGADSQVIVLGWDFRLNYLKAIGSTRFARDLFGGYHAFSYHAVASADGTATTLDACVRVDGDLEPDLPPFQEVLPTGVDTRAYLQRLSPETHARPRERGQSTIR